MHFGKVIWRRVEPWQIGTAGLIESFDLRQLNLLILTAAHADISEWIISHEIMSTFPTAALLTWQRSQPAFHYSPEKFSSLSGKKQSSLGNFWAWPQKAICSNMPGRAFQRKTGCALATGASRGHLSKFTQAGCTEASQACTPAGE